MMKALIPPDGQWHELPGRVSFIACPMPGATDLRPDGKGRVRFPPGDGDAIEVRYGTRDEHVD